MVSNVQEQAQNSPGHRQLHKQATCRQQPQRQGQPPPEHQVRPQPRFYEDPNPRAGFRKGKQKLLRRYRPPQTGPKINKATVADVQFLTAAKQRSLQDRSVARTAPLHPATPPQHSCTPGVMQQPTLASLQAAQNALETSQSVKNKSWRLTAHSNQILCL